MSRSIEELLDGYNAWETAFNEDGHLEEDNRVTITEAFSSPDAPILFPRVINRTPVSYTHLTLPTNREV